MEDLTLQEIVMILLRRKKIFFAVSGILFLFALLFAFNWSNYRSTATVQIEQSYIADNVTDTSMIETLADQRINQIQQKVTSLESLAEIIKKFNLYPGLRDNIPVAILTDKMRNKIKVEFISGVIANPAAAQKQTAEQLSAIAFELSFDYNNPQVAQQVTDELVTRFLDEDLKMRRTQAKETSAFLQAQITALESSMADQEKAIADFKAKHGESGPSALLFNQQAAASINANIEGIQSQITNNEGLQGNLRAQLAVVDPYSRVIADGQLLTTPAIQLKALETQYATLTGQYGPDHPDVVKVRHQIAAVKAQLAASKAPAPNVTAKLKAQIADVETNLAAAEHTKGPDHPDVVALKHQLKALEESLAKTPASSDDNIKADADNPAYLQLSTQLAAAKEQHKTLEAQLANLKTQEDKYQHQIAEDPGIEQEMAKLTRDYDNAQLRYRELKEKKMMADMNEQLQLGHKGQRLVVTNPPELPVDTHPRFILLLLAGFVLSIAGGTGGIIVAEATSQSIHGPKQLTELLGVAPLVVIPHLLSEEEKHHASTYKRQLIKAAFFLRVYALVLLTLLARQAGRLFRFQSSHKS